ncbi:endonuclease domain-containing protein [Gordonia zhaorongruii]|uniref:endonuclease domain-containing protein n=1 Tax=Gordonia zhaorongruii TaxID=2597659 RepID=UPI001043F2CA|nr:DUF559 domain-containing protein [Gordonia zhaorongruii]
MTAIRPGVYPTKLLNRSVGRAGLAELIRTRHARLIRRGWYEVGNANSDEVAAVARGGVLSCVSALRRHGVWVPETHELHIRGNSSAVRYRKGPFCRDFRRPSAEEGAVDDIAVAVRHAARCLSGEGFVVVCDSILNRRLMTVDELDYQFRDAPLWAQRLLAKCDGRSESGPETMARLRLLGQKVRVRTQVVIEGVGRVDLLVGDYLIIEIDGWEFHGDRQHFQSDRSRDIAAHELGFHTLRFTYADVVYRWDETNAQILAAVRAGVHIRRSRRAGVSPHSDGNRVTGLSDGIGEP